jgi:hypothetical protein
MEILRNKNNNQSILLTQTQDFKTDLGWSDDAEKMDNEILYNILNGAQNYETVRYVHEPYTSTTSNIYQTDIWFYFYFLNSGGTYTQNYEATGLTLIENYKMLKQSTESFFRLEFYKTPNGDAPNQTNRRMVFAKNLSLPLGEKIFYTGGTSPLNEFIHFPVFTGSNYRNTENMYFFWFEDDSPFEGTNITGNTFYMTAKFYNAKDGSVIDFVNQSLPPSTSIIEENHLYYKVIINRTDYSYQVFNFYGSQGAIIGKTGSPIRFYQRIK